MREEAAVVTPIRLPTSLSVQEQEEIGVPQQEEVVAVGEIVQPLLEVADHHLSQEDKLP